MANARYTICTITTTDEEFAKSVEQLKGDYTHEEIYRAGLEAVNKLKKD